MAKKFFIWVFVLLVVVFAVTGLYHLTQQADINYYQANKLFKSGDFQKAIPYYQASLAADPDRMDAARELAYSYLWTDKSEKSIELFKKVIASNPNEYEIILSLANAYAYTGTYNKAISLLEEHIGKKGGIKERVQLAQIYLWDNQPKKAITVLEEALRQDPKDKRAKILQAKALYYAGKSDEAAGILDQLLALDDKELNNLLAEVYVASQQHKEALKLYRQIVQRDPSDLKIRKQFAALLSWAEKYDESIKEYQYILERSPRDLEVMQELAQVYTWKGDFKEAENLYRSILEVDFDNNEVYILLGQVLIWQNKFDEAISYFEKIPEGQEPFIYGKALLYSGQISRAEGIFSKILEKEPKNIEVKTYLAHSYAYQDNYQKAIRLYQEVLSQKDAHEVRESLAAVLSWAREYDQSLALYSQTLEQKYSLETHRQKARVLGWARRYQEAQKEYEKILGKEFNQKVWLEMQAKGAYYNAKNRQAAKKYKRLLSKEPDNLEALFDLAQIYAYQSMWQEAISTYRRILALSPNHKRAKKAFSKVKLISEKVFFRAGYQFFKGESKTRDTDIERAQALTFFSTPLNKNIFLEVEHSFIRRSFSDFRDVWANQVGFNLSYLARPDWQTALYYAFLDYNKGLNRTLNLFGVDFSYFYYDDFSLTFRQDRQIIEENSRTIKNYLYRDNLELRADFNFSRNLKLGIDSQTAFYSDGNLLTKPGFDFLYYLSFEPRLFYIQYRYSYKEFKSQDKDYWTPKGLSVNRLTINWRHFLNKEEVFFGADNIYYDIRYDLTIDSERVLSNKITFEFNWDINEKFNWGIRASTVNSSSKVYKEKEFQMFLFYRF